MRVLGSLDRGPVADNPSWVAVPLRQLWVMPLVRICLVSAYLIGGVTKLTDFDAAVAGQVHVSLHPGWLWAALAIFRGDSRLPVRYLQQVHVARSGRAGCVDGGGDARSE